jgi:hypothetical protein
MEVLTLARLALPRNRFLQGPASILLNRSQPAADLSRSSALQKEGRLSRMGVGEKTKPHRPNTNLPTANDENGTSVVAAMCAVPFGHPTCGRGGLTYLRSVKVILTEVSFFRLGLRTADRNSCLCLNENGF